MTAPRASARPALPISTPPRQDSGREQFPLMNAMRAIALLSVVIHHVASRSVLFEANNADGRLFGRWEHGVVLAFVISGFLLYRPIVRRQRRGEIGFTLGVYVFRRITRIVPPFWLAAVVTGLVVTLPNQQTPNRGVFGEQGIAFFGFAQSYSLSTLFGGVGGGWSICVELVFYAFLPLWAWGVHRLATRRPRRVLRIHAIGVVLLIALSLVFKLAAGPVTAQDFDPLLALTLPRFLDHFAVGMGLAVLTVWLEGRPLPRILAWIDRFPGLAWAVVGVLLWFTATRLGVTGEANERLSGGQRLERHYLFEVVAIGIMLPAVVGDQRRGLLRRLLAHRVLWWIGMVSYGIFLYHLTVIDVLDQWSIAPDLARSTGMPLFVVWLIVATPITLGLAALSWYCLERPALGLKRIEPGASRLRTAEARPRAGEQTVVLAVALLAGAAVAPIGAALGLTLAIAVASTGLIAIARHGWPHDARRDSISMLAVGIGSLAVMTSGLYLAFGAFDAPADAATREGRTVHLAGTYDGRTVRLFVDGREEAAARSPVAPARKPTPLEIGSYVAKDGWRGVIDEVALYDRALAPSEVTAHWRSLRFASATHPSSYGVLVATTPGLAGHWRLDEVDGPIAGDERDASPGRWEGSVARGWTSLVPGDPNRAARFARKGRIFIPATPALETSSAFSVEAIITAPAPTEERPFQGTVFARGGAWFLKTDIYGDPAFAVTDGRAVSAASKPGLGHDLRPLEPSRPIPYLLTLASLGLVIGGLIMRRAARLGVS